LTGTERPEGEKEMKVDKERQAGHSSQGALHLSRKESIKSIEW